MLNNRQHRALAVFSRSTCRAYVAVVAVLACLATVQCSSAMADPTYGVMNAEGGIYWRSAPDWNTPEAIAGNGFYPGTVISVHCYQSGAGNVPGSADTMWEQASVASGPGSGSGWINEHFVNDGQAINQPSPKVPPCGGSPPVPPPPPPASGPGPTFSTMNAAGGIYWRSAPDWNTPVAVPGNGVYEGTTVAVHCYQAGTSVPGSNDTMWEQASVVSGPGSGSGWINEHFVNDGAAINQPSPGVPPCGGTAPATTSPPKAPARATEQVLVPDPAYWCVNVDLYHHFGTQIREADWKVEFIGVHGTPHQNDWKCSYSVVMTFPGPEGQSGPLAPVTEHFPIDFREVCAEQFPGSRLQYELGPIYSSAWPWECIGPAGKYYPPPTLSIGSLLGSGGFKASGIPVATAGSLDLQIVAGLPSKSGASAASTHTVAAGSRSVDRAGRYSLRVRLTRKGRRLLRHVRRLRTAFTLRFTPSSGGRSRERSTKVMLKR
jgi:hypothetical protein